MVCEGQRKLTVETAERFSVALGLTSFEKDCLVTACTLERAKDAKSQQRLSTKLAKLKRQVEPDAPMNKRHVEILSDLDNLKLYLLAQSKQFKSSPNWISKNLSTNLSLNDIEHRIALLLDSGLWIKEDRTIRTMAPSIDTGDAIHREALIQTHKQIFYEAKRSLTETTTKERVIAGRTFLCDPKSIPEIKARIDAFRNDLESDFECLDSTKAYQIQLAFFEIGKTT